MPDETLADAHMILRLRRGVDRDPFTISKFVACSLDERGFALLAKLKGCDFSERSDLEALLEMLKDREASNRLTSVLEAQRAMVITTIYEPLRRKWQQTVDLEQV